MAKINPTSFNLPEDLKQRFKVAVAQQNTDQSSVVRACIESWIRSTESQSELEGKSPGTKAPPGLATMPSGHRISKSLMDLIPQLESVLEDREAAKLLKRLIHSLYHQSGAGVDVESKAANHTPSSRPGRRFRKGDRYGA